MAAPNNRCSWGVLVWVGWAALNSPEAGAAPLAAKARQAKPIGLSLGIWRALPPFGMEAGARGVELGFPRSDTSLPMSATLPDLIPEAAGTPPGHAAPASVSDERTAVLAFDDDGPFAFQPDSVLAVLSLWHERSALHDETGGGALSALWDGSTNRRTVCVESFDPPARSAVIFEAREQQSGHAQVVPGSVFNWRPVEDSPGHGVSVLDRLARRLFGRKGGRFQEGYVLPGAASREDARVYFYGERHSDRALIAENMKRLAADLKPGRGAVILDEGYFGPRLYGSEVIRYLSNKGFDSERMEGSVSGLELRGWDDREVYEQSRHSFLQHHMNLLDINEYLYSPVRGLRYYMGLARKTLALWRNWAAMRSASIMRRNVELDKSVRAALCEVDRNGDSLHVIAGAEHLVSRPLLSGVPFIGRPRLRPGLRDAVGGRPYWARKPADSKED